MTDTIFARATAAGRAGIAVVRISGPAAMSALGALSGDVPPVREPALRWLRDPASGDPLDRVLVLAFAAPASFTGEDVAELHLHGSPAVCRAVLTVLEAMNGLRPAEPGEFTRRALLNGRLDLAEVEGLGDLLAAETAAQHRQALRLLDGTLSRLAQGWRQRLVDVLAHVEACIDFADDALPAGLLASLEPEIACVVVEAERELAGSVTAERLREGFEVALVGRPNVGKSTLLNALAGREAALTSSVAGTTRDVIEVRMDVGGLPVTLLDMAGMRAMNAGVEALGIARARERADRADLRIFLVNSTEDVDRMGVAPEPGDLVVLAKADLRPVNRGLAVSGRTGFGIDTVLAQLEAELQLRVAAVGTVTHERQRVAVERMVVASRSAVEELRRAGPEIELVAEELRAALRALDFLLGKVDVEAILDVIFSSFCIGK
jgi:tRNA modification GTPase